MEPETRSEERTALELRRFGRIAPGPRPAVDNGPAGGTDEQSIATFRRRVPVVGERALMITLGTEENGLSPLGRRLRIVAVRVRWHGSS